MIPNKYFDFHVHVGEMIAGYQLRDGFADLQKLSVKNDPQGSGDEADAFPLLGGIGAFVTEEVTSDLSLKLSIMQEMSEREFGLPVKWHLTPTHSGIDELFPLLNQGCDLKLYTTYKYAGLFSSYQQIDRWMQDIGSLKSRILVHCEDDDVIQKASQEHPFQHPFDHTKRRPEIAEIMAVDKVLNLAIKNQHPVHIVHVSSPHSALLIKQAKEQFDFITCETAPHYLLHNEDWLKKEGAHRYICSPPFRSEMSRGMLVELLQDGIFDILASDHCAFNDIDKDRFKSTPEKVPCGIPGVATLYSSIYEAFVANGILKLETLNQMTCKKPAEMIGVLNG